MELEEWLQLYQAVSVTAGVKERGYWTVAGIFLLANCLLAFPLAFFFFSYTGGEGRYFITVLGGIGVLLSLSWSLSQKRIAGELSHLASLLRSIEGQFAGGEFHRSLHKLLSGEEVCVPATSWKCKEWQSEVTRLGWCVRTPPQALISILPVVFLLAWVTLAVIVWLI